MPVYFQLSLCIHLFILFGEKRSKFSIYFIPYTYIQLLCTFSNAFIISSILFPTNTKWVGLMWWFLLHIGCITHCGGYYTLWWLLLHIGCYYTLWWLLHIVMVVITHWLLLHTGMVITHCDGSYYTLVVITHCDGYYTLWWFSLHIELNFKVRCWQVVSLYQNSDLLIPQADMSSSFGKTVGPKNWGPK